MEISIFAVLSFLTVYRLGGISGLMIDPVVPMNEGLSRAGYDLKLMYNYINKENLQDNSTPTISPIKYKYDKIIELLKTTVNYYEKEVPKTSQNVKKFLNTTLTSVSDKCLLLNDPIGWRNFRTNYIDYRKAVKKLQEFLISPKETDNTIDDVILTSNLIIKMGNFIHSFQYCFDDQERLTDEEVMRVMALILHRISKNIFLAGEVKFDTESLENSKSSECSQVLYPMPPGNFLFNVLMDDFYSPFESCCLYQDFEKCAADLLENCGPELAAILKISWCPPNSNGCSN